VNALTLDTTRWTETDFTNLDLGDACLSKRAWILMERLAVKPTAGVPQVSQGWGERIPAYRLFDNDEVKWTTILELHWG
jgi:hypothetical protein